MLKLCDVAGVALSSDTDCSSSYQLEVYDFATKPAVVLPPCGHTEDQKYQEHAVSNRLPMNHLARLPAYTPRKWVAIHSKPRDTVRMGSCRINGRDYELAFKISSCRPFYPLAPHPRDPARFPCEGFCITAVKLPPQLAPYVTGLAHINDEEDVPFGNGVWGRPVEGIMLELTKAPASASICYRVSVASSTWEEEEASEPWGFTTDFCPGGKFCGTRGQARPLQSLCIEVVWPDFPGPIAL
jgi:hypothetical protein